HRAVSTARIAEGSGSSVHQENNGRYERSSLQTVHKRLVGPDQELGRLNAILRQAVKNALHLRHVKGRRSALAGDVGNNERYLLRANAKRVVVVAPYLIRRFRERGDFKSFALLEDFRKETLLNAFHDSSFFLVTFVLQRLFHTTKVLERDARLLRERGNEFCHLPVEAFQQFFKKCQDASVLVLYINRKSKYRADP